MPTMLRPPTPDVQLTHVMPDAFGLVRTETHRQHHEHHHVTVPRAAYTRQATSTYGIYACAHKHVPSAQRAPTQRNHGNAAHCEAPNDPKTLVVDAQPCVPLRQAESLSVSALSAYPYCVAPCTPSHAPPRPYRALHSYHVCPMLRLCKLARRSCPRVWPTYCRSLPVHHCLAWQRHTATVLPAATGPHLEGKCQAPRPAPRRRAPAHTPTSYHPAHCSISHRPIPATHKPACVTRRCAIHASLPHHSLPHTPPCPAVPVTPTTFHSPCCWLLRRRLLLARLPLPRHLALRPYCGVGCSCPGCPCPGTWPSAPTAARAAPGPAAPAPAPGPPPSGPGSPGSARRAAGPPCAAPACRSPWG